MKVGKENHSQTRAKNKENIKLNRITFIFT